MIRVSVCMPSFNQAPFLAAAIESALAQTFREFEIVIVDDGSTDDSRNIQLGYTKRHPDRIRALTHPDGSNHGISATTNIALKNAIGEFACILDSDDLWYPHTLERRVAFMDAHPDTILMCSHYDMIDASGNIIRRMAAPDISADCAQPLVLVHRLIMGCDIGNPTVMFRREKLAEMELFDPGLIHGDWELWVRVASRHRIAFLPEALAMHRRHERNITAHHSMETELERRLAVMRALELKAPSDPGVLRHPRLRALIALESCSYSFCLGDRRAAAVALDRALRADPTLFADQGKYFSVWLSQRPHVPQPRSDFHAWIKTLLAATCMRKTG